MKKAATNTKRLYLIVWNFGDNLVTKEDICRIKYESVLKFEGEKANIHRRKGRWEHLPPFLYSKNFLYFT